MLKIELDEKSRGVKTSHWFTGSALTVCANPMTTFRAVDAFPVYALFTSRQATLYAGQSALSTGFHLAVRTAFKWLFQRQVAFYEIHMAEKRRSLPIQIDRRLHHHCVKTFHFTMRLSISIRHLRPTFSTCFYSQRTGSPVIGVRLRANFGFACAAFYLPIGTVASMRVNQISRYCIEAVRAEKIIIIRGFFAFFEVRFDFVRFENNLTS